MAIKVNPYAFVPPAVVARLPACSPAARDAAYALATQMGQRGYRVVSQSALAAIVGKGVRSMRSGLEELRKLRLIIVTPEGRKNRYRWNADPGRVQGVLFDAPLRIDRAPRPRSTPSDHAAQAAPEPASGPKPAPEPPPARSHPRPAPRPEKIPAATEANPSPTEANPCLYPNARLRQISVTTEAWFCLDQFACKDARAEATKETTKETTSPLPPAAKADAGNAPPEPLGGGGSFVPIENRRLAGDFARRFAVDLAAIGFSEDGGRRLADFAVSIPCAGADPPFAERLALAYVLIRIAGGWDPGETQISIERRMLGYARKHAHALRADDPRRRAALDYIRRRAKAPEEAERRRLKAEAEARERERQDEVVPGRIVCPVCGWSIESPTRRQVDFVGVGKYDLRCEHCRALLIHHPPPAVAGA